LSKEQHGFQYDSKGFEKLAEHWTVPELCWTNECSLSYQPKHQDCAGRWSWGWDWKWTFPSNLDSSKLPARNVRSVEPNPPSKQSSLKASFSEHLFPVKS